MATLIYRERTFTVEGGISLQKALEQLEINSHSVLAVRDGKIIRDNVILEQDDEIKLVAVVSGG